MLQPLLQLYFNLLTLLYVLALEAHNVTYLPVARLKYSASISNNMIDSADFHGSIAGFAGISIRLPFFFPFFPPFFFPFFASHTPEKRLGWMCIQRFGLQVLAPQPTVLPVSAVQSTVRRSFCLCHCVMDTPVWAVTELNSAAQHWFVFLQIHNCLKYYRCSNIIL